MTPPPPLSEAKAYVYLLRSLKDSNFYLGWTTNCEKRLATHNAGLVQSTAYRRPFEMIYFEEHASSDNAKNRERKLKHNPRMLQLFKKRAIKNLLNTSKEVVG